MAKKKVHLAEATIFVRLSNYDKAMLKKAVDRMNARRVTLRGKLTMQDFVLESALRMAKRVLAPSVHHVTGRARS